MKIPAIPKIKKSEISGLKIIEAMMPMGAKIPILEITTGAVKA